MSEKVTTYGYLDFEEGEIDVPIELEIDTWDAEPDATGPEAQYPGCSAGAEVSYVSLLERPNIEDVRKAIRWLSGDEKTSVFEHSGVEYTLDYDMGVLITDWDSDTVLSMFSISL